jgi:dUTP pyrophosphatase
METQLNGNSLGEMTMIPVGTTAPAETVNLETTEAPVVETEAPKKKAGRPSNAEKAARAAAPQAEARTATGPVEPAPAKVKAAPASGETVLGVFAMNAGSVLPELATSGSGAFDIRANLHDVKEVVVYTASNKKSTTAVRDQYGNLSVILQPRTRAMIPTGLIFDIPAGFKLELSARSGLSLKEGLNLANGQALIDSDYVEETFILIQNNSDLRVEIKHGDRIAQAALARVEPTALLELSAAPARKSERAGGLGSTGVQ